MKKSFAEKLKSLFTFHKKIDDEFFEALSDSLIEGDVGQALVVHIEDELRKKVSENKIKNEADLPHELAAILLQYVKEYSFVPEKNKNNIFLLLGVNGVGKTTTIAKLAQYYQQHYNENVLMVAADTFRAAAIDQLKIHGEKLNCRVIANQQGGDSAAVVFDAGEALKANGGGLALVDTAGRLHNRKDLVRELEKIDRIAQSKADAGCYKKIIVLDSTTGQNAVRQAEVFQEAIGLDAAVLTKYDSTAKGGVVISAGKELNLPFMFVCFGEQYGDIKEFSAEAYVKNFLGL